MKIDSLNDFSDEKRFVGVNRGVSPIVGVALLVLLVAIAATGVGVMVFELSEDHQSEPASASVDVEHHEGFSMTTHSVEFTATSTWKTSEIVVRGPSDNICTGKKTLEESGDTVSFDYCSKGDEFVVVAHSGTTSYLIKKVTI